MFASHHQGSVEHVQPVQSQTVQKKEQTGRKKIHIDVYTHKNVGRKIDSM